jgi:hypothetical protein
MKPTIFFTSYILGLGLCCASHAATVSISALAPTVDGADIANDSGAADAGGDQRHMWSNRPHQGQTFVTGSNSLGYQLNSVTLKNRNNTITNGPTFNVVVGSFSGTVLTEIGSTETAVSPNYSPNDYITFAFDTTLTLGANTTYGFLWGSSGSGFVTVNNLDDSTYTGGTAISSGGITASTIVTRGSSSIASRTLAKRRTSLRSFRKS